jgi:hypothetical protein
VEGFGQINAEIVGGKAFGRQGRGIEPVRTPLNSGPVKTYVLDSKNVRIEQPRLTTNNQGAAAKKLNLDNKYGDLRQPYGGIKDFEQIDGKIIPNSELQVITQGQKAAPLEKGKRYIWAVDNNGNLRIGVETQLESGKRLGHPSLVGEEGARVGGEIKLNSNTKEWRINDRSGRFSRGRSSEERSAILMNAHKLFTGAGLNVGVKF